MGGGKVPLPPLKVPHVELVMIDWPDVQRFAIKAVIATVVLLGMGYIAVDEASTFIPWPSVSVGGHDLFTLDTLDRLAAGAGQPTDEELKAMLADEKEIIKQWAPVAHELKGMFK